MNVADALRTYERLKQARRQELCGSLEGGPDAYNYLPERCVRKPNRSRGKSSKKPAKTPMTLTPDDIPTTSSQSLSKSSLGRLKTMTEALAAGLRNSQEEDVTTRINELSSANASKKSAFVTNVLMPPIQKLLDEMPEFIAYACYKFTEASLIEQYPNHTARWEEVCKAWDGINFSKYNRVKFAVFSFAYKSFEKS